MFRGHYMLQRLVPRPGTHRRSLGTPLAVSPGPPDSK
jgi:hypothetical protein